ncbi:potassium voltage-gated channel subfamily KQT member 1 [Tachysurus ichikawai]
MRINEYDNHPKHFVYTTVHFYPLNSLLRHLQNLQWVLRMDHKLESVLKILVEQFQLEPELLQTPSYCSSHMTKSGSTEKGHLCDLKTSLSSGTITGATCDHWSTMKADMSKNRGRIPGQGWKDFSGECWFGQARQYVRHEERQLQYCLTGGRYTTPHEAFCPSQRPRHNSAQSHTIAQWFSYKATHN